MGRVEQKGIHWWAVSEGYPPGQQAGGAAKRVDVEAVQCRPGIRAGEVGFEERLSVDQAVCIRKFNSGNSEWTHLWGASGGSVASTW